MLTGSVNQKPIQMFKRESSAKAGHNIENR